jgi:hypothetical protein
MTLSELIQSASIFNKYYHNIDGHHISAEHEEIRFDGTHTPITPEDLAILYDIGWFQRGGFEDGEYKGPYDPEEAWFIYV